MYRKDYIVNQFEELGKVLALILFFKKQKNWENFEKEISLATKKFTSMELDHVEKLDPETFKQEILENEKLELEQKKILASLLFEKLDYYSETAPEKLQDCTDKCLMLYSFLHDNQTENEFSLEVFYRLEFLKNFTKK